MSIDVVSTDGREAPCSTSRESERDERHTVDKAFSLLLAFGTSRDTWLGVSELARRTDLSKSSAFRVLGMLERNGMVEKRGTKYRLGAPLVALGRSAFHARQTATTQFRGPRPISRGVRPVRPDLRRAS